MKRLFSLALLLLSCYCLSAQWQAVGSGLNSSTHGFALWDNKLVDVGSFNNPCNRVAAWNGSAWSCFAGGVGLVGRAAIEFQGDLVVVGDFWNVQQPCSGCNGVARWNGTSWQPLGTGFNNDVLCLTIWNGQLVAGGDFTQADGNPVSRIARWNGTTWVGIGGTNDFDNDIRAMAVYNNELWVGGDFNNVGGCTACDGLVKWDGAAWVGGNSGVDIVGGVDSTVRVLYVDPASNRLYMAGHFLELNGNTNMSGVAYYDGSDWYPMGTGVNSYVRGLGKYNGTIIVGGDFTTAGGFPANKIARWNPNNNTWAAMGTGMDDYVKAIEVYNGQLYAGGAFTQADGLPRGGIARWQDPASVPVAAFNANDVNLCAGECSSFADNSTNIPTTWNWSVPGATPASSTQQNPQFCFNSPGSYTVTLIVSNMAGADTLVMPAYVSVASSPVVNAGNDVSICAGASTTLGATGASNYQWTPGATLSCTNCTSPVASPAGTTTYYVTGTSANGCTDVDSVVVTVQPITPVNAGNDVTLCSGTSTTLNASGATSYTWTPAAGLSCTNCASPVASPNITTTYTVTGTAAGSCPGTDMVTITVNPSPVVNAGNDLNACANLPISLSVSGATSYSWSPASGLSCNNCSNPTATLSTNQTYIITGTTGSCTDTDTLSISIVSPPVINAGNDTSACAGEMLQLLATGATNYTWSPAAGLSCTNCANPVATLSGNATFIVTGFYQAGCDDTDTIEVTILPAPVVNAGADQTICQGESVTLTATGATTISWNNGISNGTAFAPTGTASYVATGSNANGCEDTDTVLVTVNLLPNTQFSFAQDTLCDNDAPVTLNGTPSGGSFSGTAVSGNTFDPTAASTGWNLVIYTFTNSGGCTRSDTDSVFVHPCLNATAAEWEQSLVIYPNPGEGYFEVKAGGKIILAEVTDMAGRKLEKININSDSFTLDLRHLPAGIYTLYLQGAGQMSLSRKLSIVR